MTPGEPRQRWRLTFERQADPLRRAHREIAEGWIAALASSGLPLPRSAGRPRSPIAFAAPLPAGMACLGEVADILLAELRPCWWVKERLIGTMPDGARLLRLDDVWLGTPPVAAAIRAADYTVALAHEDGDVNRIEAAARRLMAAPRLERDRARGGSTVRYDIRPLVDRAAVEGPPDPCVRIRVRFHPDRGAGRPEEVIAALEELAGQPIAIGTTVRERLVLDGWP